MKFLEKEQRKKKKNVLIYSIKKYDNNHIKTSVTITTL